MRKNCETEDDSLKHKQSKKEYNRKYTEARRQNESDDHLLSQREIDAERKKRCMLKRRTQKCLLPEKPWILLMRLQLHMKILEG